MSSSVPTTVANTKSQRESQAKSTSICYLLNKTIPEIRNIIYELVFTPKQGNKWNSLEDHELPDNALIMTCSQINKEAGLMYRDIYRKFYSTASFCVDLRFRWGTRRFDAEDEKLQGKMKAFSDTDLEHVTTFYVHPDAYSTGYNGSGWSYKLLDARGLWQQGHCNQEADPVYDMFEEIEDPGPADIEPFWALSKQKSWDSDEWRIWEEENGEPHYMWGHEQGCTDKMFETEAEAREELDATNEEKRLTLKEQIYCLTHDETCSWY